MPATFSSLQGCEAAEHRIINIEREKGWDGRSHQSEGEREERNGTREWRV